jgi:hypothetical protein
MTCRPSIIGARRPQSTALWAFTLLELLLSIGAAALILLAVQSTLFTTLRLQDRMTGALEAAVPLEMAFDVLRRDLQCVVPPKVSGILSGGFRSGNVLSTGISQPVSLELNTSTGTLLAAEPWADIQRVTYSLKPSADGSGTQDLYRGVCRNLLASSTPDSEDQLLLRNVRNLDIQSYDGMAWYPIWDTTDTSSVRTNLPVAVRVRIYRGTDDEDAPAELLVPIGTQSRTNSTTTVGG